MQELHGYLDMVCSPHHKKKGNIFTNLMRSLWPYILHAIKLQQEIIQMDPWFHVGKFVYETLFYHIRDMKLYKLIWLHLTN